MSSPDYYIYSYIEYSRLGWPFAGRLDGFVEEEEK